MAKARPRTSPAKATALEFIDGRLRELLPVVRERMNGLSSDATATAVHDARVAARRLRSALRMWRPLLPRRARQAADTARAVMHELDALRELDVLAARLAEFSNGSAPGLADAMIPALESLRQRRDKLAAGLAGNIGAGLVQSIEELLAAQPGDWPTGAHADTARVAGPLLKRVWSDFRKALKRARARFSDARCHRLRIAGKRLRYCLDALGAYLGKAARPAAKSLRKLQDQLGDYLDARNGEKTVRAMRKELAAAPATDDALRVMAAALRNDARQRKAALPGLLDKMEGLRFKQFMRTAKGATA